MSEANVPHGSLAPQSDTAQPFYTRKATGLTREISLGSNIALNISNMGIAFAALALTTIPFAYPGANFLLSALIATVLSVAPVLLFGLFTAAMPRSGGDYLFVGRTIHPWLGLATNFNITAWYLLVMPFLAFLLPVFGVSTAFATIGAASNSSTLTRWSTTVTEHNWTFGIAVAALVFVTLAASLKLQYTLFIAKIIFAVSVLCVGIAIILLIIHDRTDFKHAVTGYGGNYDQILADAHKGGYHSSGSSFGDTFLSSILIYAALGYGYITAYTAGELRSVKRQALRGKALSLAIAAIPVIILFGLASRTMGRDFLGSATYLSNTGSTDYPFAVPSNFFFYVDMLVHSTVLVAIIGISFAAAILVTMIPTFLVATRDMFAWSFDRMLPTKVSEVNDRTHSPLVANAIILGVGVAYLAFLVWGAATFFEVQATLIFGPLITFIGVAIAAIVLPFTRREFYRDSPINFAIGPVPVISLVGLYALGVFLFVLIAVSKSEVLGVFTHGGVIAIVVISVISVLFYPIAYMVNRARGVDLGLAMKELPPE